MYFIRKHWLQSRGYLYLYLASGGTWIYALVKAKD